MGKLAGKIIDKSTGRPVEARVQVLSASGAFLHPRDAILKVGTGLPFFYSDGEFVVDAPRGVAQILVERGTEYIPARVSIYVPSAGSVTLDIDLERWTTLSQNGWHPGNTHIHYDDHETRPDDRLNLDPRVEDLRFTAISILKRWDKPYASNIYPPGVLTDFCTAHHYVECGEENRHNSRNPPDCGERGYGHIMLLRIQHTVEPISRGYLVDDTDPDYPPLCYACDDAHRQGGIVIWCHNGTGMEAPVAAALGKLDAFNLFDPYWMDPEYDLWYALLNCGFRLPASTGSDWFICSANRVYTYTGRVFDPEDWFAALQSGRTFITNGPALMLSVDGQMPGSTIRTRPGAELGVDVAWDTHYAIESVEVLWNGKIVAGRHFPAGIQRGRFAVPVGARSDGWIAARVSSTRRDSFFQPVYAHTSPVYVIADTPASERADAAVQFDRAIEQSLEFMDSHYRFQNRVQRREVKELFRQGQSIYRQWLNV